MTLNNPRHFRLELRRIQAEIVMHRRWLRENGFGGVLKAAHVQRFIKLAKWKDQAQMETFKRKPRYNQHWMIRNCMEFVQHILAP
tara:strand:- start:105 stop:359 length:255 start_codon:yes stop_codon:yes gene_type:complete